MRRWTKHIRALELFGEKNRLGRGSDLGHVGGNLCLWGPERFFSVVRNAQYTYPLFGRAPIRWAFVHDIQGTHRDEYFYSTDTSLSGRQIASWFTARWPIETTFQEVRTHLGFETPRQYVAKSVLRTAPCLLGLFSVVCLIFAKHARCHRIQVRRTQWYVKAEPTFSDAIAAVRRLFWQKTIFEKASYHKGFKKLSPKLRNLLLDYLSQAA